MGARFSPTYVNLYKGWWEEQHIYNAHNLHRDHIISSFRYIDDRIFIVNQELLTTVVPELLKQQPAEPKVHNRRTSNRYELSWPYFIWIHSRKSGHYMWV